MPTVKHMNKNNKDNPNDNKKGNNDAINHIAQSKEYGANKTKNVEKLKQN